MVHFDTDTGELNFPLFIHHSDDGAVSAFVTNGTDTTLFTDVSWVAPDSVRFYMDYYDLEIRAKISQDGALKGFWQKRLTGKRYEQVSMRATELRSLQRYDDHFFTELFDGEWAVTFTDDEGESYPAVGIFYNTKEAFFGTFLTETGDYRYLEGVTRADSSFILSVFDGAHAFLFTGKMGEKGKIVGDFTSRKSYHESFVGEFKKSELSDPFKIAKIVNPDKPVSISFPDLDGKMVSLDDVKFKNKPILLYLFGSWCPNCADEAKMIKEFYTATLENTDLEIIGLAFEYSGDFKEDAEMVARYKARFDIPWTTLVAGISDKESAGDKLPFVKEVSSFPSAFFLDRNHKIVASHVGFRGPGTGAYYIQEKNNFIKHINTLLQ